MLDAAAVVLVEGVSDQVALEALAVRLGRNLAAESIAVFPMGGASSLPDVLDDLLRVQGFVGPVAGLCDLGEIGDFRRGLERAELGVGLSRSAMETLGFYACVVDLEDEFIRSLGAAAAEKLDDA